MANEPEYPKVVGTIGGTIRMGERYPPLLRGATEEARKRGLQEGDLEHAVFEAIIRWFNRTTVRSGGAEARVIHADGSIG